MKKVWKLKEGSRIALKPQAAGERIEQLEAEHGIVTPKLIVQDSRKPSSPFHRAIEHDVNKAAEKYQEEQARGILRSLYYIIPKAGAPSEPTLGFVHVTDPEVGPCYVSTSVAVSREDYHEQILSEARASLAAWERRYGHLQGLRGVVAAIRRALAPKKKVRARAVA